MKNWFIFYNFIIYFIFLSLQGMYWGTVNNVSQLICRMYKDNMGQSEECKKKKKLFNNFQNWNKNIFLIWGNVLNKLTKIAQQISYASILIYFVYFQFI